MRALLALDGSPSADVARQAVASLAWPTGSVVHVVGVIDSEFDPVTGFGNPDPATWIAGKRTVVQALEAAAASLRRPGLAADATVMSGRPATVIVDQARQLRADLVVVGSRGRGPLASLLLGSVSAEVVDHAPCPVLVVRAPIEGPTLVAVDGSASANGAVTYLVANPITFDRPIEVVSVAHRPGATTAWEVAGLSAIALEGLEERHKVERRDLEAVAARAATRLRATGYRARWSLAEGHAPEQIIATAAGLDCDLIVMGSRGMTGLKRIVLGSVARAVLLHTPASVLIVREPIRDEERELADAGRPPARITAATA
jgi:nucleotide-binding universal stress UspA family protein